MNKQTPRNGQAELEDHNRDSGSRKSSLRNRSTGHLFVVALAVAIFISSIAAAYLLYQFQKTHEEEVSTAVSRAVVRELTSDIFELEKSLLRVSAVHQSRPEMSRQTFSRVMRQTVRDLKPLRAIGWAPLVQLQGIDRWIKAQQDAKSEMLTYQTIRALKNLQPRYYDTTGSWSGLSPTTTGQIFAQDYLAPILYIEDEIGKVLSSAPHFKDGIAEATKTGSIKASITQVTAKGKHTNTLFRSVYSRLISPGLRRDLHRERKQLTTGLLNFQLDLDAFLQASLTEAEQHNLGISVTEILPDTSHLQLFKSQNSLFDEEHDLVEKIEFFGNTWLVRVHREALASSTLLPSALALLAGLTMILALLGWHTSNIHFKRQLQSKLQQQKREITQKTGLIEAVLDAAPVGIEYIDEAGITQLQNNLSKIGSNAETAHETIIQGTAEPAEYDGANTGFLSQKYRLTTNEDDGYKHYEIICKALAESADVQLGNIVVSNNVTEREAAQQKLKGYIAELEATNQELEEFTYSATHDMQEPLRRIASFSEILEENIVDGDLEDARAITARLISSSTDLRRRFSKVVEEIDNRNRRRAEDNHRSYAQSDVSIEPNLREKP